MGRRVHVQPIFSTGMALLVVAFPSTPIELLAIRARGRVAMRALVWPVFQWVSVLNVHSMPLPAVRPVSVAMERIGTEVPASVRKRGTVLASGIVNAIPMWVFNV